MSTKIKSNDIELVDLSSNQELTNKTIDASLNTITNLPPSASEWGHISGDLSDQTDLQNVLNDLDADVSDTQNKVQYIVSNPNALYDLTGWSVYNDGPSPIPVDGSGGTPTDSLTLTRDTSSKVIDETSFAFEQAAFDSQGQGVSTQFTISNALKNTPLNIQFRYTTDGFPPVYGESGDIKVFIYDIDNAQLITPAFNYLDGNGLFQCQFHATTSANYRLILHVATTNNTGWKMFFGDVQVKAQTPTFIPFMSDMEDAGPMTITATTTAPTKGTTTSDVLFLSRSGDKANIVGYFQGSFSNAGSGDYLFSLPYNLKFNANKTKFYTGGAATFSAYATYGIGKASLSTVPDNTNYSGQGVIVPYDATRFRIGLFVGNSTTYANAGFLGSSFWGGLPGSTITFDFSAPIQGWTSGVKTQAQLLQNVPVSFSAMKNGGSTTADQPITSWTTIIEDNVGGFNNTTGEYTFKVPGSYSVNVILRYNSGITAAPSLMHRDSSGNLIGQYIIGSDANTIYKVGGAQLKNVRVGDTLIVRSASSTNLHASNLSYFQIVKDNDPSTLLAINRSTTKYLASDLTSTTNDIASLKYNGTLVVGKRYKVEVFVRTTVGSSGAGGVKIIHDGQQLGETYRAINTAGILTQYTYAEFTATNTSLSFNWVVAAGAITLNGNNTGSMTKVTLTELNNTVEGNF